jgi:hypothetical protein
MYNIPFTSDVPQVYAFILTVIVTEMAVAVLVYNVLEKPFSSEDTNKQKKS